MDSSGTLQEAIDYFADADKCVAYLVSYRWPYGVLCPICGRGDATYLKAQKKWQCKSSHAKRQFTAKVGTIFEDSPLSLATWLTAFWMVVHAKNGVSSSELARSLGVTQKTAWLMMQRIGKARRNHSLMKVGYNGWGTKALGNRELS